MKILGLITNSHDFKYHLISGSKYFLGGEFYKCQLG